MSIAFAPFTIRSLIMFNQEIWLEYCSKIEDDFKLKTYPHFDNFFDFRRNKDQIKHLISNPERIKRHAFLPFVKVLSKKPRLRYNTEEEKFKLETKIRPLLFASHFDTYIYGYYSYYLNKKYINLIHKLGISEAVLAYRPDLEGKCNIQFAHEAFNLIKDKITLEGGCSVIALDIKGFFDNIGHNSLHKMWCYVLFEKLPPIDDKSQLPIDHFTIFKSLTNFSYVNLNSYLKHFEITAIHDNRYHAYRSDLKVNYNSLFDLLPADKRETLSFNGKMSELRKSNLITNNSIIKAKKKVMKGRGIPQGSAMSATLSNIYLIEFDKHLVDKAFAMGFQYRRYCDDILIICKTKDVEEIISFTCKMIQTDYGLEIQDKKTEIIHFEKDETGSVGAFKLIDGKKVLKNLQYLGFEYNGKHIYIRSSSLSRYFRKMKAAITRTILTARQEDKKLTRIFKRKLILRYTHIGHRNFLTYAYNASKATYKNSVGEIKLGMNSPEIRKQISLHMDKFKHELEKTKSQLIK